MLAMVVSSALGVKIGIAEQTGDGGPDRLRRGVELVRGFLVGHGQ